MIYHGVTVNSTDIKLDDVLIDCTILCTPRSLFKAEWLPRIVGHNITVIETTRRAPTTSIEGCFSGYLNIQTEEGVSYCNDNIFVLHKITGAPNVQTAIQTLARNCDLGDVYVAGDWMSNQLTVMKNLTINTDQMRYSTSYGTVSGHTHVIKGNLDVEQPKLHQTFECGANGNMVLADGSISFDQLKSPKVAIHTGQRVLQKGEIGLIDCDIDYNRLDDFHDITFRNHR